MDGSIDIVEAGASELASAAEWLRTQGLWVDPRGLDASLPRSGGARPVVVVARNTSGLLGVARAERAELRAHGNVATCAFATTPFVSGAAPNPQNVAGRLAAALGEAATSSGVHLLVWVGATAPASWQTTHVGQMRIVGRGTLGGGTPVPPHGASTESILEAPAARAFVLSVAERNDRRLRRVRTTDRLLARFGGAASPYAAAHAGSADRGAFCVYRVHERDGVRQVAIVDLAVSPGPAGLSAGRRLIDAVGRVEQAQGIVAAAPPYAWESMALVAAGMRLAQPSPHWFVHVMPDLDHTLEHADASNWRLDLGDVPFAWTDAR